MILQYNCNIVNLIIYSIIMYVAISLTLALCKNVANFSVANSFYYTESL